MKVITIINKVAEFLRNLFKYEYEDEAVEIFDNENKIDNELFDDLDEIEVEEEAVEEPEKVTLGALMNYYIDECKVTKSESTIKSYRSVQRNYFKYLQEKDVYEITASMVQGALDNEIENGKSQKSVKNAFSFLKACFEYAVSSGLLENRLDLCQVKVR